MRAAIGILGLRCGSLGLTGAAPQAIEIRSCAAKDEMQDDDWNYGIDTIVGDGRWGHCSVAGRSPIKVLCLRIASMPICL